LLQIAAILDIVYKIVIAIIFRYLSELQIFRFGWYLLS